MQENFNVCGRLDKIHVYWRLQFVVHVDSDMHIARTYAHAGAHDTHTRTHVWKTHRADLARQSGWTGN